jgi:hypothetical protein
MRARLVTLENINTDTMSPARLEAVLNEAESIARTWESLPGELTTIIEGIRRRRDHVALLQWVDTLTPTQKAELKARFFSEE